MAIPQIIGALVISLACCVTSSAEAGWKIVFEDNFSAATLDRTAWSTRYIFSNETLDKLQDEQQAYSDNHNHVLHNGVLALVARKAAPGARTPYQSGMIRSLQTFYYGYFEARVKMPEGAGSWPAFWLGSDFDPDGYATHPPEIDIFDNANNGRDSTIFQTTSGTVDGETHAQEGQIVYADRKYDRRLTQLSSPGDSNANWHVFGLLWTPDDVTVWRDGHRLYTRKYKWVTDDGRLAPPAHILFSLAVGGHWAGRFGIDDKKLPFSFLIDYIRVCQLDNDPNEGQRTCGKSAYTPNPATSSYVSNAPGGGDALRPFLTDAELAKSVYLPGETVAVKEVVHSPISTAEAHSAFFYLVDQNDKVVAIKRQELPIPTTAWADEVIQIETNITLPLSAAPGHYRVFLAVGTPEKWDPDAKIALRAMTFAYDPVARERLRVSQPLRYLIGEFQVSTSHG